MWTVDCMGVLMTPAQLLEARQKLGLTLEQLAPLLGYESPQGRSQIQHMESGKRTIRPAQRRLVEAYLAGYRPEDWPKQRG